MLWVLLAQLAAAQVAAPAKPAADPLQAEGWKVSVAGPKSGKVGTSGKLEVSVEARGGYHINDDYPLHFDATPQESVKYAALRVDKAAATLSPCKSGEHACRAKVPVAFTPSAEGTAHVAGTLAFSACDDAHCLIEKVPVALDVAVTK
jgi:hypothetical protein